MLAALPASTTLASLSHFKLALSFFLAPGHKILVYVFGNARCQRYSAGRPCWTKTERQGLVDGALGPADDVRDVSTSQTSTAVASRDGAEQVAKPTVRVHVQVAAGVIDAD